MSILLLLVPQLKHLPLPRLFASARPHRPQLLFSPHLPGPIHLKVLAQFVSDSVSASLIFHEHPHTSLSLRETLYWTGHSDCRSTLLYFPPMHLLQEPSSENFLFWKLVCRHTCKPRKDHVCTHSATARRPLAGPEPGAKMATVLSLSWPTRCASLTQMRQVCRREIRTFIRQLWTSRFHRHFCARACTWRSSKSASSPANPSKQCLRYCRTWVDSAPTQGASLGSCLMLHRTHCEACATLRVGIATRQEREVRIEGSQSKMQLWDNVKFMCTITRNNIISNNSIASKGWVSSPSWANSITSKNYCPKRAPMKIQSM